MAKFAGGTLVVFAFSVLWLILAWSSGNKTNRWTPTLAQVVANDVQKTTTGRLDGWLTKISYTIEGLQ